MQNNVLCELMTMKSDKENRGQGENPVFRITKKPPSETGVKKPRYLSPFFYGFEFS